MEELDNEKYNNIESIETFFRRINRFGYLYNYCFATFTPPPSFFSLAGVMVDKIKKNNITGYFVNRHDRGICLIPLIVDENKIIQIDMYNYIDIKNEDIQSVKIKNENFTYKKITLLLKNKTKYVMVTAKRIKGVDRHEVNVLNFIQSFQNK